MGLPKTIKWILFRNLVHWKQCHCLGVNFAPKSSHDQKTRSFSQLSQIRAINFHSRQVTWNKAGGARQQGFLIRQREFPHNDLFYNTLAWNIFASFYCLEFRLFASLKVGQKCCGFCFINFQIFTDRCRLDRFDELISDSCQWPFCLFDFFACRNDLRVRDSSRVD